MKNYSVKTVTTVLLAGLILTGCNQYMPKKSVNTARIENIQPICTMPTGKRVGAAFSHVKEDLASDSCQHQYDRYFSTLIDIATGDPAKENRKRFSDFITWSYQRGIISKVQGKDYYTRYFSPTFKSLSDTRNVCSATRDKAALFNDLQAELKQKKKGLLQVSGDRDAYFNTLKEHNDIVLVLEATAMACVAQG